MNLRDLEYLVALDEFKHFRKAAEHCYVSQPTLSGQLKKLERYLGVQLVERGRRQKVLMTPIGEKIAVRARRILQEAREIEQLAQLAQDPLSGQLKIGLIPTLAPYLLPHIVAPLKQHFPDLELLLYEVQTDPMLVQLQQGELELGILALPIEEERLQTELLFEEAFCLVTYPEHPLAHKQEVCMDDLNRETILLLDDGHCFRDQALEVCFTAGAHEKESFRGTSLETLKQMVSARSGLTLLPRLAVQADPHPEQLQYIPFVAPQPTRQIGLVYRPESPRVEAFHAIGKLIRELNLPEQYSSN